jgi:hypothetical protein
MYQPATGICGAQPTSISPGRPWPGLLREQGADSMDVLENILEKITEVQEARDNLLREAEEEEQKIAKLESMYYLLEDPTTQELMRDVVVGMAVQNGVAVPNGNNGAGGDKHYVGMQRVREYVKGLPPAPFTVIDVYTASVTHRGHGDPKFNHPEFERQRKASISLALMSMTKAGDLEIVKLGRGREVTVFRKIAEGK